MNNSILLRLFGAAGTPAFPPMRAAAIAASSADRCGEFASAVADADRLHERLTASRTAAALATAMLNTAGAAFAILAMDGTVTHVSDRASQLELFADPDTVVRRLRWFSDADAAAFDAALTRLSRTGTAYFVARGRAGRSHAVVALLPTDGAGPLPDPHSILVQFFTGTAGHPDMVAVVREAYGLTRAEARLAAALADTLDLARAAETIGISIHTARTYVKRIFQKTETTGQPDLVRLLTRLR